MENKNNLKNTIEKCFSDFLKCSLCNSHEESGDIIHMLTCGDFVCDKHPINVNNKSFVFISDSKTKYYPDMSHYTGDKSAFISICIDIENDQSNDDESFYLYEKESDEHFDLLAENGVQNNGSISMIPAIKHSENRIFCRKCHCYQQMHEKPVSVEIIKMYLINKLAESDQVKCEDCDQENPSHVCLHCAQYMCSDHAILHRKSKKTKDHIVTSRHGLLKRKADWMGLFVQYCASHDKHKVTRIDRTTGEKFCDSPNCCPAGNANIVLLSDYCNGILKDRKVTINSYIDTIGTRLCELKINEKRNANILDSNEKLTSQNVSEIFDIIRNEINRKEKELLEKIKLFKQNEELLAKKRSQDMEQIAQKVNSLKTMIENLVKSEVFDTCLIHDSIHHNLFQLYTNLVSTNPVITPNLKFQHSVEFVRSTINSFSVLLNQ